MASRTFFIALAFIACVVSTQTAHVLFVPGNVYSHLTFFADLGRALQRQGHKVTSIHASTMPLPQFYLDTGMAIKTYSHDSKPFLLTDPLVNRVLEWTFNFSLPFMNNFIYHCIENFEKEMKNVLEDKSMMEFLFSSKFDVAVVDMFLPYVILPYKLSVPYVVMGAQCSSSLFHLGNNPAAVPHFFVGYTVPMSFRDRIKNTKFYINEIIGEILLPMNSLTKRYVSEKAAKSYFTLTAEAALCFQLRDSDLLSFPTPLLPNIIDIGGIVTKPSQRLPEYFEELLSSPFAEKGVILVVFGSWIDKLPFVTISQLFDAFRRLDYLVIFKYSRALELTPPENVVVRDWVPQNDLLGNHNVKLIVSHCGISSVFEAVYHAVPILGIPLFWDQSQTASFVEARGFGLKLDISSLDPEELVFKANAIIESTEYKRRIIDASQQLKEKEAFSSSGNRAVFWIEHVIKYGGNHLRPLTFDQPWYARHMIDVILVILACTGLFLFISLKVLFSTCKFVIFLYRFILNKIKTKRD